MKIFDGTVRMALETGTAIVPIACAQYGKEIIFNIGETYLPSGNRDKDVAGCNRCLRDMLATLSWEIYETQPQQSRAQLPADALERYLEELIGRADPAYGLKLEDAYREMFHDKTVTDPEEVFASIRALCRW